MRSFPLFALLIAAATVGAQQPGAGKEVIVPAGGRASRTLSPGIRVGNLLFVSGQLGTRAGQPMDSTIQGQTAQALENMKTVLEAAKTGPDHVVKCTVFLLDMKDFQGMNA